MNHFYVKKSSLEGEAIVPPSKSHTLRAILFATLAEGKSIIRHYLDSTDTRAMIEACRLFGAEINIRSDMLEIMGVGGVIAHTENVIDAGNSGLVLRFCAAVGALAKHPVVITGDYSVRHHRPMQQLLSGLSQAGVSALSMRGDGFAPVIIQGPLKASTITIDGKDSQPVSALLIASALAEGPTELFVTNPGEKPWVGLTLDWFDRLGIPYANDSFTHYRMQGKARFKGFEYEVPGDHSTAAFPIAAALITQSELTIKNVDMSDSQGDKELVHVFQRMGARIEIDHSNKMVHVKSGGALNGITVDINNFIDSVTILAVVACFAEGETIIRNAEIARHKECNRLRGIVSELKKMGADIIETDDGLKIRKRTLNSAQVHSHDDHRMAMSLAVAALAIPGETQIMDVNCTAKTFPAFMQTFRDLGASISHSKNI